MIGLALRRSPASAPWIVAAFLVAWAGTAHAQEAVPTFELERLQLNPGARDSLVISGGRLLEDGHFRLSLSGHYERDPLVASRNAARLGAVISDRVTGHLAGAYGLGDGFEFGFQLPVVAWQQGEDASVTQIRPPAPMGLGTPEVSARLSLLSEEQGAPLALALGLGLGLPIGSAEAVAREPGFVLTPRLGASKDMGLWRAAAEASFTLRSATRIGSQTFGHHFGIAGGVSTVGDGFRAEVLARALLGVSGGGSDVEVLGGVRYPVLPELEVYALGGPGFGDMPGSPLFRVLLGAAFGGRPPPPPPVDPCAPDQAQPVEACPDLDKDEDGVKNAEDTCATTAEDRDGFEDEDGCPDRDDDGDTLVDGEDACPRVRGLLEHKGCPPPDRDQDGILDADDACPTEAGIPEKKGCPFRDADGDGMEDGVDACPEEAGVPETRGCPVKDTDGDTVSDHLDNCVDEKGDPANQGCPRKNKQLVVITREKLIIKDKVYFASGRSTILRRSHRLLDQIARVIKEHPEIPRVIIEGHTDSRGSAELNRKLSLARAEAVRDFLVDRGVNASRLEAVGFGPDRPADTNETAAGREANRRVEFNIVDAPEQRSTSEMVEPLVAPEGDAGVGATDGGTAPAGEPASDAPDAGTTQQNAPDADAGT